MKSHRSNRWQRLVAPPLAAWLGACGAQSAANVENTQAETPRAGVPAPMSAGTPAISAGQGGTALPPVQMPVQAGSNAAGAGAVLAAGSGATAGASAATGGVGGEAARAGAGAGMGGSAGHAGAQSAGAGGMSAAGSGGAAAGSAGAGGMAAPAATFTQVFTMFTAGCSCHSSGAGGLNLGSKANAYTNLVGAAASACSGEKRVVAGDADKSVLFHAVARTDLGSCKVPKMPAGAAMLSAADLEVVRSWIAAGAQND